MGVAPRSSDHSTGQLLDALSAAEGVRRGATVEDGSESTVLIGTEGGDAEENKCGGASAGGGERTVKPTELVRNKHPGLDVYA